MKNKYVVMTRFDPGGQRTSCFIWKKDPHFGVCKYIYITGYFRILQGGSLSPVKVVLFLTLVLDFP